MKLSGVERIHSCMNKKDDKRMSSKERKVWKTIAVEEKYLEKLREEAARDSRSPTSMLGLILKARYEPK